MTGQRTLLRFASYGALVAMCALVVAGAFLLFHAGSSVGALLVLSFGAVVWGVAAGALRANAFALPAIALGSVLAIAYEYKRIYVLDYVGGPPARSVSTFTESIFLSDFLIAAVVALLGWLGWRQHKAWDRRKSLKTSRRTKS